ncbi:MAG: hypothetical protein HOQ09_13925 [Gemmatimonadaceae bacterium]|nr:hypothetical protein [Gemmatimonadaceae bacterium]
MSSRSLALVAAIIASASCTDLPSDPKAPFAVEFRRAPSPSVVSGDSLRDSLGVVAPLRAVVFNAKGDTIKGAAVKYRLVPINKDSVAPAKIDSVSGHVTADTTRAFANRSFRVYAEAGGIQTLPETLYVTRRPDALVKVDSVVTLRLSFLPSDSLPNSPAVSVRLRHITDGLAGDTVVPHYEVRFRITSPASAATDTSYVMLTGGDRRRSEVDTTDASGLASREVRVRRALFPLARSTGPADSVAYDSIHVEARAYYRNGQIAGSPASLLVIVTARKTAGP